MNLLRTTVTTLVMHAHPVRAPAPWPAGADGAVVAHEPDMPLDRYRALYAAVGRPHHWTSRLLPDDRLAAEIHAPEIAVYTLSIGGEAGGGETGGWFEIETHAAERRARIVHFAVMPAFRGRHLAGPMLDRAIRLGFGRGVETLTIETNTLDHPLALRLYQAHGFRPVQTRSVLTPPFEAFEGQIA